MTTTERWLPIPGWEGRYEVSDQGRVRSLARTSVRSTGSTHPVDPRMLTPLPASKTDHLYVGLTRNNQMSKHAVHRLVLAAFVGPCPPGMETRHDDDNPRNNILSNLRYGTRSQNHHDRVRNGIHHNAKLTHCKRGHEFTPENTLLSKARNHRTCRACKRLREAGQLETAVS